MPDNDEGVSSAQAFESLVTDVYQPLQRYLRRRTDIDTAHDVLGDVLLVMWRRADAIPAEAPLAWCYGVARRCLANSLRQTDRQRRLETRLRSEVPVSESPSDPILEEALAKLSTADQELLRLWAWEHLAASDIALVLGITANAASIRLHRAIKKLEKQLGERKEPGRSGQPAGRQERKTR